MLDTHRNWFKNLELQTAKIFKKLPLSPNQYTLLSVAAALVMAYFVISGGYIWALVFLPWRRFWILLTAQLPAPKI